MEEEKRANERIIKSVADRHLPEKFSRMSGMEKLNAILGMPDAVRVIRSIEPQEFYFLVRDIGRADSTELIMYATPEQLKTVFDMEVWHGDRFSPQKFAEWFEVLTMCGFERSQEALLQLDSEILMNFIMSQADISLMEEEEKGGTGDFFVAPDGQFRLVLRPGSAYGTELRGLIDLLYSIDANRANHQMHLMMRELPSALESDSLYLRNARLQDLGFPSPEERFDIYKTVDLGKARAVARLVLEGEKSSQISSQFASEESEFSSLGLILRGDIWDNLLGAVLLELNDDKTLRKFYFHFKYLVNKLLYARTDDLSDENEFRDASVHAASIVSLGLEYLSGGVVEKGAKILKAFWLKQIYQVGWTLVYNLREEWKKIKREQVKDRALDSEDPVVEGLKMFPPLYWRGLDDQPKAGYRDFKTLDDMARTSRAITASRQE